MEKEVFPVRSLMKDVKALFGVFAEESEMNAFRVFLGNVLSAPKGQVYKGTTENRIRAFDFQRLWESPIKAGFLKNYGIDIVTLWDSFEEACVDDPDVYSVVRVIMSMNEEYFLFEGALGGSANNRAEEVESFTVYKFVSAGEFGLFMKGLIDLNGNLFKNEDVAKRYGMYSRDPLLVESERTFLGVYNLVEAENFYEINAESHLTLEDYIENIFNSETYEYKKAMTKEIFDLFPRTTLW